MNSPAWRAVPTCPGVWLDLFGKAWDVDDDKGELWLSANWQKVRYPAEVSDAWFGPIPDPPTTVDALAEVANRDSKTQ